MMQLTQLSWYKLVFLAELLAAEGIFCRRLRRRSWFGLRLAACVGAAFGFAAWYPLGEETVLSNSVLFFSLFFVTLVGCKICFEESWWNILFCGIAAYSVQHIAFVVYNMVVTGLGLAGLLARMGTALNPYGDATVQSGLNPLTLLAYADCYFLVYWYVGYFISRRMARSEDLSLGRKPLILFSALGFAVNILLHMVTVMNSAADPVSVLLENVYNLLCCLLILLWQFGVLSRRRLEQDRDLLEKMLAQKEEQYKIRKESMELINIKHHDLKHQLGLLRKVVGFNIMDSAVFLLLASLGYIDGGTAPIVGDQGFDPLYINPIPSGLVLTGIVVSVSITAFSLALIQRIYRRYGTIELRELLERARKEDD